MCLSGGFLGPGTFGAKTRPVLGKLAQAGQQTPSPDPLPHLLGNLKQGLPSLYPPQRNALIPSRPPAEPWRVNSSPL